MRFRLLQTCYVIAAIVTLLLGWLAVSGKVADMMLGMMAADGIPVPAMVRQFYEAIRVPQGLLMTAIAALFVFLAWRPYWWGKLICLWAALSWTGFGVIGLVVFGGRSPTLVEMLVAGLAMLCLTATLQAADPRLGGTYLRSG